MLIYSCCHSSISNFLTGNYCSYNLKQPWKAVTVFLVKLLITDNCLHNKLQVPAGSSWDQKWPFTHLSQTEDFRTLTGTLLSFLLLKRFSFLLSGLQLSACTHLIVTLSCGTFIVDEKASLCAFWLKNKLSRQLNCI